MSEQDLLTQLAARVQNKYYGKYRGFVQDNADPEKRGRLCLIVPSVLAEEVTGWALPCLPIAGMADAGLFLVPEVGAQLWVEFEEGDLSKPIWVGGFWQKAGDAPAKPEGDEPTRKTLKTPAGHLLEFEDAEGEEYSRLEHPSGAALDLDKDGNVALTDANGARLFLNAEDNELLLEDAGGNKLTMNGSGAVVEDANGNKIEMAAGGVTVKGAQIVVEGNVVSLGGQGGEPIIKGSSFLSLFATHIHTSSPMGGPTSPPIPQGEMSSLSTKVMTS